MALLDPSSAWYILQTSAGRTLALAASLAEARIEAWTPRRTIKRPAPGAARRYVLGRTRPMIEVTVPILPGFVFARADRITELLVAERAAFGPHPGFSILRVGDRAPLVGNRQVEGLRAAEAEATAAIESERAAETREQARRARAEQLRTEDARRKALRREVKALAAGSLVEVAEMPALAGMTGKVVESRGASAVIDFGGALTMTVEAWRIHPVGVQDGNSLMKAAA